MNECGVAGRDGVRIRNFLDDGKPAGREVRAPFRIVLATFEQRPLRVGPESEIQVGSSTADQGEQDAAPLRMRDQVETRANVGERFGSHCLFGECVLRRRGKYGFPKRLK